MKDTYSVDDQPLANRFHQKVKIESLSDFDAELGLVESGLSDFKVSIP
jgi:hypothetical protein